MRKILQGFLFGIGLFLALLLGAIVSLSFVDIPTQIIESANHSYHHVKPPNLFGPNKLPFEELTPEEQVRFSSVVALSVIEESDGDGMVRPIITEQLKNNLNNTNKYRIGNVYHMHGHYPRVPGESEPEGYLIIVAGEENRNELAISYVGNRLFGLGELSLPDVRKLLTTNGV